MRATPHVFVANAALTCIEIRYYSHHYGKDWSPSEGMECFDRLQSTSHKCYSCLQVGVVPLPQSFWHSEVLQ